MRRRGSRWRQRVRTHALALVVLVFLLVSPASSQEAFVVHLAVVGHDSSGVGALFGATLSAESGELLLAEELKPEDYHRLRAKPEGRGLYLLANLSDESVWRLEILSLPGGQRWRRTIPGPAENPAAPEAAVAVLTSAALALVQDEEEPVALDSWVKQTPPIAPLASEDRPPRASHESAEEDQSPAADPLAQEAASWGSLEFGAGYSAASWGSALAVTHGPGAHVAYRAPAGWLLGLTGAYHLPQTIETGVGSFDLQISPLSAFVGYGSSGTWQWSARAALRAEITTRENSESNPGQSVTEGRARWAWGAQLGPGVRYQPNKRLGLELCALGEYFPTEQSYRADGVVIAQRSTLRFFSSLSLIASFR